MKQYTYKSCRFIDGKVRWVIVDKRDDIIDINPSKKQLRSAIIKKRVRKQDFKSDAEYQDDLIKRKGFDSWAEYQDDLAQKKGYKDRLERDREYNYDVRGQLPMSENKDCPAHLGVNIAEKILAHVFKKENVERMPYGHKGYDFICGKGKKVDAKSSSLLLGNEWFFNIRQNNIAEQFLLLVFGERPEDDKNPKPMHLWLVPKDAIFIRRWKAKEFWDRTGIWIKNTPLGLLEFEKYELKEGLEHIIECCE